MTLLAKSVMFVGTFPNNIHCVLYFLLSIFFLLIYIRHEKKPEKELFTNLPKLVEEKKWTEVTF